MGFFDVAHVQLSKLEPDGGLGEVEVRYSRFRPIAVAFSVVAFAPLERKSVSTLVAKNRYRSGSDIGAIVSPVILASQAENAGSIPVIRSKPLSGLAEQGFSTCIDVFWSCIYFLRLPRFAVDFAGLLSQRCRKSRGPLIARIPPVLLWPDPIRNYLVSGRASPVRATLRRSIRRPRPLRRRWSRVTRLRPHRVRRADSAARPHRTSLHC